MKPSQKYQRLILAVNAGSSSLKFALFHADNSLERLLTGKVGRIGLPNGTLAISCPGDNESDSQQASASNHSAAMTLALQHIEQKFDLSGIVAVGHRVVQGGEHFIAPTIISNELLDKLRALCDLEPEHLPSQIKMIEAAKSTLPSVPQVACFDTAFHADLPRVAQLLAIPRRFQTQGVRRYGFHGLSCEFLMAELERVAGKQAANGKVILAHLGNGSSLTAVLNGRSVETTMGFTSASGVPMSTRAGDIDPGLVRHLLRDGQMSAADFHRLLTKESGLLGISETSSDMRDLRERESSDYRAAEAIALYCQEVKKRIGALAAVLSGLDTLAFSGGIGENCFETRKRICDGLDFLGIEIDSKLNKENSPLISIPRARVAVRVIPTNEEWVIARATMRTAIFKEKA